MSRCRFVGVASVVAILTTAVVIAQVQMTTGAKVQHIPSSDAQFKEVVPGVAKSLLWGDDSKGAYGAFTRFKPGLVNAHHTHTNDIRIVVLEGAYIYKDQNGEKRAEAGDYLFIAGGTPHESSGDVEKGSLFYEESSGKFDLVPVK